MWRVTGTGQTGGAQAAGVTGAQLSLAPGSGITDRVSRWEQGQHGVVFQGELITRMFQMCNMGAQVQRCRLLCGAAAGSSPEPGRRPVVPSSRAPSRLTEKTRVTQQHTSDNVGKY